MSKVFTFEEDGHVYKLDGKLLTGVTTILGGVKQIPLYWAANETVKYIKENCKKTKTGYSVTVDDLESARKAHTVKKEGAADFGTHVHKAIEEWIKEEKLPLEGVLTSEEYVAFENFKEWSEKENAKFLESEIRLYSEKHWFAGTCDLVLEIGGKVWIGDIKTSSGIYPEFFWQTAAYQLAMQEHGMYPNIEGHVIINVKKDGRVEVERSYGYDRNVKAFLACLEIYRVRQALKNEMK